jgi:hypothetical protein
MSKISSHNAQMPAQRFMPMNWLECHRIVLPGRYTASFFCTSSMLIQLNRSMACCFQSGGGTRRLKRMMVSMVSLFTLIICSGNFCRKRNVWML